MTTYNCGEHISQAIKSILNQTYKDFELLIIDDGSTDNTEEIVTNISDKRIKYLKRNHYGRSASLNYGLNIASNDLIALMDADDICDPSRLEKQINAFSKSNDVVFCSAAYFKNNKILFIGDLKPDFTSFMVSLVLHGPYNNASALYNRKHILRFEGYQETFSKNEDHELWLRIKNETEFKIIPEILYYLRIRVGSLTYNHFGKDKKLTYSIQEKYFKNLKNLIPSINEEDILILEGWREYFYGHKREARNYWAQVKPSRYDYRIWIAFLFSYLPDNILNYIKNQRLRLRLNYYINRFTNYKYLDQHFKRLFKEVS